MATTGKNTAAASFLRWFACAIGGFSVVVVLFATAVISGIGIKPGAVPYIGYAVTAEAVALFVGVPLGGTACYFGRKRLGVMSIALCLLPVMAQFFVPFIKP